MTKKKPHAPRLTVADPDQPAIKSPDHLGTEHRLLFQNLISEKQAMASGHLTPADLVLIRDAACAAQAAADARKWAAEAQEERNPRLYAHFAKEARQETATLKGLLISLQLSGDRRTQASRRKIAQATTETGLIGASDSIWAGKL